MLMEGNCSQVATRYMIKEHTNLNHALFILVTLLLVIVLFFRIIVDIFVLCSRRLIISSIRVSRPSLAVQNSSGAHPLQVGCFPTLQLKPSVYATMKGQDEDEKSAKKKKKGISWGHVAHFVYGHISVYVDHSLTTISGCSKIYRV